MTKTGLMPVERIAEAIIVLRGQKVILDKVLAALYEVPPKHSTRLCGETLTDFRAISCSS